MKMGAKAQTYVLNAVVMVYRHFALHSRAVDHGDPLVALYRVGVCWCASRHLLFYIVFVHTSSAFRVLAGVGVASTDTSRKKSESSGGKTVAAFYSDSQAPHPMV